MKPQDLVFDLFGDYLRYSGGQARLQVVVALLDVFDVPASTARVVMTRMRQRGWLDARRDGRSTVYSLTDRSWQLLDEGRRRIFERPTGPWDRQWRLVIYSVPESDRAARERMRKQLRWLGFGALGPATWVSPHERLAAVAKVVDAEPSVHADLLVAHTESLDASVEMATRSWDLKALHQSWVRTRDAYRSTLGRFREDVPVGRDALRERVTLVHDYRLALFNEPDLPGELLPEGWAGHEAHTLFRELHELLREEAERHCRMVIDELG